MSTPYTVIYIDRNFIDDRYPNSPEDGDSFYTHGFSALYAREFKKYHPEIDVECWKADARIKKVQEKVIKGVTFRMFPAIKLPWLGQHSPLMLTYLAKREKEQLNTILNISSFDHILFYSIALKIKQLPIVVQNHGESTARYKVDTRKGIKKWLWRLRMSIENRALKKISLLYLLDERLKEWLPLDHKIPIIKIQGTGVEASIFPAIDKIEAKNLLGLDPNIQYLLYIGRLNNTKRPDMLINVYEELKKERHDIGLILAGNEKSDPYYNLGLESGALMYGVIKQTELHKYLSAASVYALPLLDKSIPFGGVGMLSVQAMLCNTPAVGSTIAAISSEVRNEVGIVSNNPTQLKAAILKILSNSSPNYQNIRSVIKTYYAWENIAHCTMNDYNLLFAKQSNQEVS
jgi:glycosyltransferase involved in cell wall biosynthesis